MVYSFMYFFVLMYETFLKERFDYIFERQNWRGWGRESCIFHLLVHPSKGCSDWAGRSQEATTPAVSHMRAQGSKNMGHLALLSQTSQQGAGEVVE